MQECYDTYITGILIPKLTEYIQEKDNFILKEISEEHSYCEIK